jgi:hypothetical protein
MVLNPMRIFLLGSFRIFAKLNLTISSLHTASRGTGNQSSYQHVHLNFPSSPYQIRAQAAVIKILHHEDVNSKAFQYCEFGGTAKKCEEWLKDNHPDLYERLYSEGMLAHLF